jgi:hypothetical protein
LTFLVIQVRNFAVKLLTGSDPSFRGEYMQYNLGAWGVLIVLSLHLL